MKIIRSVMPACLWLAGTLLLAGHSAAETVWTMSQNADGHLWLVDVANNRHSLVGILSEPGDVRGGAAYPAPDPSCPLTVNPSGTLVGDQPGYPVTCWATVAESDDKKLFFIRNGTAGAELYWIDSTAIQYWDVATCLHIKLSAPIALPGVGSHPNVNGLCYGPDHNLYFTVLVSDGFTHNGAPLRDANGQQLDNGIWRYRLATGATEFVGYFQGHVHFGSSSPPNQNVVFGGLDFHPVTGDLYGVGIGAPVHGTNSGPLSIYELPGCSVLNAQNQVFAYHFNRTSTPGGGGLAFGPTGGALFGTGAQWGLFHYVGQNAHYDGNTVYSPIGNGIAVERIHKAPVCP